MKVSGRENETPPPPMLKTHKNRASATYKKVEISRKKTFRNARRIESNTKSIPEDDHHHGTNKCFPLLPVVHNIQLVGVKLTRLFNPTTIYKCTVGINADMTKEEKTRARIFRQLDLSNAGVNDRMYTPIPAHTHD